MHDARIRRDHAEIVERALAPAQERITLLIALKLDLVIEIERIGCAVVVNLD